MDAEDERARDSLLILCGILSFGVLVASRGAGGMPLRTEHRPKERPGGCWFLVARAAGRPADEGGPTG